MTAQILTAMAGIGLFLIGMIIMTEGLRALAGDSLRRFLRRFTRTAYTGALAGAATTALVQSSSVTIVTAIGFVSAGLLQFPQALGIIFGANIGTTLTGWLVAVIGFKLKLGAAALPLILVGVLLRLFTTGRWQHAGWALAGFGLLFVGIDTMKDGLASLQDVVTPALFPDASVLGCLKLVGIGAIITLVTQSSSAGVAAALVALSAESITFAQAAAMVIGMDIGTTAKAALATLGGTPATRRTGYAHVIYNLLTGVMALLLLIPVLWGIEVWTARGGQFDAQIGLVAFHTLFNGLGVVLALPLTGAFARLIERLVPSGQPDLARRLDDGLLSTPGSAIDAVAATLNDIFAALADMTQRRLEGRPDHRARGLQAIEVALDAARSYAERIRSDEGSGPAHLRHVAILHALDHLMRLTHRLTQAARIDALPSERTLHRLARLLACSTGAAARRAPFAFLVRRFNRLRKVMRGAREEFRVAEVESAAAEGRATDTTLLRLDSVRWLHRTTYHYWRIAHHLAIAMQDIPPAQDGRRHSAHRSEARLDVAHD